jgi:hypothetical protein
MEKLPIELKTKIMRFLPINDTCRIQLMNQIKKVPKINKIINCYKKYWMSIETIIGIENARYSDWLFNDIISWMNDLKEPRIIINLKYQKYASQIFKKNIPNVNIINSQESYFTSLQLSKMYLFAFDTIDFNECISFLHYIISMSKRKTPP